VEKITTHFKNKKILITGHTGFKGSWLTLCLAGLNAKILGISKDIPTTPSHYSAIGIKRNVRTKKINICNLKKLKKTINEYKPDYIFHLAAQSLVKKSYEKPLITWETNLMGTINILEILKEYKNKIKIVIITSDKSYKNIEKKQGYKESDRLGGLDPYSASKASAELAIQSYFNSFIKRKKNISLAVARAGNVIGGGDWSKDRLIPDCIKAWSLRKKVIIRNSNSTRPWQHVLEAVWGYIILAYALKNKKINGEAFNFGPNTMKSFKVIDCVKIMKKYWAGINWKISKIKRKKLHEAGLLKLNSYKAKKILKWHTVLTFKETIKFTSLWYKNYYSRRKNIISKEQIENYKKIFNKRSSLII
jgi:CDP-glucose 4,6-dehydratase|tara:strand:- start:1747 stop:2832 length:1086 start_codon:yes stop_codon:yes gene_type:complete